MAKGGKGGSGGGVGGGGNEGSGQSKKLCQVFLRNLPLAMLEPDIETMLADCGPIKRIDLIKTTDAETGAKRSRGFGFVTFALESDATKAVSIIHRKRVMGREVSCEIALKKGAKREGNGREQQQQQPGGDQAPPPGAPADRSGAGRAAGGGEVVASTYGGGGSAGGKPPAPARNEKPPAVASDKQAVSAAKESIAGKAGDGGESKASGRAVQLAAAIAAAEATGLGKKEARKFARKAMKKELKKKAKDRAKNKKEEQAKLDAAAAAAAAAAEAAPPAAEEEDGDGDAGGEESKDEEPVDPKAAKLLGDAKTVLVFGVAEDLTAKQLQKRLKKYATLTACTVEENERGYFPTGRIARVVCCGKEGTRKIITGIDGHTVHGQTLRARRLMEVVPGHDVRLQKQQRLIIRNLNFHAKEEDLAEAFSEFGPLSEVHIPTVKVTSRRRVKGTDEQESVTENRSRGFGFVQFLCPKDAARVVKDHGVLKIKGRDAAVDYSITKEKYSALNQGAPSTPAAAGSDDDDNEEQEERGDGMDVDSEEDDDEEEEEEEGGAAGGSDDDESEGEEDGAEEPKEGGPDAGAGVERAVERKQQRAPDVNHGCTIFVRNVAFDSSQEEVKERFSEFGDVRLALLVKDRATGMPRGTAFVKYSKRDDADRCLAAAIGATDPAHARDSGGSCIYLGSRALHVTRAVDREEAGRLTVGAQKRVGHKDKRNLYLADEGLVLEDSGAAEGAAKSDMEKRVLARKDKKSKLKNPIFFVSPTRLSVRNIGRHVTDGKLKSMAAAAARAGVQAGRANPQDVRLYLEAQGEEFAAITPKRLQIPAVTGNSVVKAKIIRDMDKKPSTDDPSELHPSKGYGFVEFSHHGQALAALRQMNNNPAYSGQAKSDGAAKGESSRLIVEFSVENHAKLKLQQGRKEAFEQRKRELKALGLGQDGRPLKKEDENKEMKSRGKIQREKKKQQQQQQAESGEVPDGQASTANTGSAAPSSKKKRKKPGAKATPEEDGGGGDAVVDAGDAETDGLVGGRETEGEDRPKRKKKKKKTSPYERMDQQERAYQKLEKAYTAKTEVAAAAATAGAKSKGKGKGEGKRGAEAVVEGGGGGVEGDGARRKGKSGRWFD
ncbi:unnamed protein product [Ectocarpus sp. 6 AP-2014]